MRRIEVEASYPGNCGRGGMAIAAPMLVFPIGVNSRVLVYRPALSV